MGLQGKDSTPRYKPHIVVKGFQHKKGVDLDEIFAPVVKMTSIQIVLSIATSMDLEIETAGCQNNILARGAG